MSESFYIRPAKKSYGPQVIVAVYPETWSARGLGSMGESTVTLRCIHAAYTRRTRGKWTDTEYHSFEDFGAFWDWLENDVKAGRRIHVFAPAVCTFLTQSDFWARVEERGHVHEAGTLPAVEVKKDFQSNRRDASGKPIKPPRKKPKADTLYRVKTFSAGSTTEILRYRTCGRSFQWANFGQYIASPENEIARALDWRDPERFVVGTAAPGLTPFAAERSLLWCRFLRSLAEWWVKHDGGPWGPTAASCAYSWLRKRLAPRSVCQHDNEEVGQLEERAIFAGRRSVWFVGNVGTPDDWLRSHPCPPSRSEWGEMPAGLLHCDVRSMYPYLLATNRFPVRFLELRSDWSVSGLAAAVVDHGIIAAVTLFTSNAEYPIRTKRGIRFPRGRFATTLCGPELRLALAAGEVESVGEAAVYQLGTPFKAACEPLLKMRAEYREAGNRAWELFAKNLGNSMSGKIAQKPFEMVPRPYTPAPCDWGWWFQAFPELDEVKHFRTWAGMTYERVAAEGRIRPMGAAYAYLTSFGRVMMRAIRETAGPRGCVAQDTDGVWLTPAGAANVYRGEPRETFAAGSLTVTCRTPAARFWGPQHYWFGGGWVLSGMCVSGDSIDGDRIIHTERPNPIITASRRPEPNTIERRVERRLGTVFVKDAIGPDGWTEPMNLWQMSRNALNTPAVQ